MTFAPIAVFIFNRPEHVAKMLKCLAACPEFAGSPLYVYCDGPRDHHDVDLVNAARDVARTMLGNHGSIVEQHKNRGIANSIIAGVSEICEKHGRVIVIEDDLLVDPAFLQFMNAALDKYAADPRVMQVSGHAFDVAEFDQRNSVIVLPFVTSWGWATWRRAWSRFDPLCIGWEQLKTDGTLRRRFNLDGAFDYYSMLVTQMRGGSDAWDIRWTWAVFRDGGLVIYPPRSLVLNIGFDGSGTHGWRSARRALGGQRLGSDATAPLTLPVYPQIDDEDYRLVKRAMKKIGGGVMWRAARLAVRSLRHRVRE